MGSQSPEASPKDTGRNFLLFLSHLVEPRLFSRPRHFLWLKGLKWEPPDTFWQLAIYQETGEQPEQVLSLKNERTYQDSEFGLATIRDDVRLGDLKRGKTAKRSQDQHDGMLR